MKQSYMHMKKKKYRYILPQTLLFLIVSLLFIACSNKASLKMDSAFDPAETLTKADQMIKDGYNEDARELLEEITAKDASRQYAIIARLRIADTYFADELYDEAAVKYENFLNIHSHHKYASYAQFRLAMTYFKRLSTVDVSASWARKAIKEFKKLQRNYPRNPYMDITESRIKMCKRLLAQYEFYVGNFYYKKGSYEAAVTRFNGMLENYPDSKMESNALYYLGLSYKNMGQRDKAINILSSLIEKFPTIELASEAKDVLASFNDKK